MAMHIPQRVSMKSIVVLIASLLIMVIRMTTVTAQTCPHDGDVNQDGTITPADALLAFQHFLGIAAPPLDTCQHDRANVDDPEDSAATPADALCIFQKFLGLPSCLDDFGNGPPPPPPPPPTGQPFDLSGDWEGAWQYNFSPNSGTVTVAFHQAGNELTGAIRMTGSPCLARGTIAGTVDDTTVVIDAVSGPQDTTHFTGIIDPGGDRISGTYEVAGGRCHGDRGTWQLVRVE
jgi:hypothetical protein